MTNTHDTIAFPQANEKELKQFIANIVRQVREARGWTCERVSQAINMTVSDYRKLERGQMDVEFERVLELAFVLNVSMDVMLGITPLDVTMIEHDENLADIIATRWPQIGLKTKRKIWKIVGASKDPLSADAMAMASE